DDAAPLTLRGRRGRAFDVLAAGEDDRAGGRAFGEDLRAAVDQQIVVAARGEDAHAGFDGQDALGAARGRGGRIDAPVGADRRTAVDGVDGAGAQRHRQIALDLLRQLTDAQGVVGDQTDVGEAGGTIRGRGAGRRVGRI